ncbi:hypothetical protein ACLMJK_000573 [Lecanora helva]
MALRSQATATAGVSTIAPHLLLYKSKEAVIAGEGVRYKFEIKAAEYGQYVNARTVDEAKRMSEHHAGVNPTELHEIGFVTFFVTEVTLVESRYTFNNCMVEDLTTTSDDSLTQMMIFSIMIRCVQEHCESNDVNHLGMAMLNGPQWICIIIPGLPKQSEMLAGRLPLQSTLPSTHEHGASLKTESPGSLGQHSVVPSHDGLMPEADMNNPGLNINRRDIESGSRRHRYALSDDVTLPRESLLERRENISVKLPTDPVNSYLDNLVTQPSNAQPQPLRTSTPGTIGRKEYCMKWVTSGECNYLQQGCKYKHEIPSDPETRARIGIRKTPEWVRESDTHPPFAGNTTSQPVNPWTHRIGRHRITKSDTEKAKREARKRRFGE